MTKARDAIILTANCGSSAPRGKCARSKWPMCLRCATQYLLILLSAPVVRLRGYGLM